MVLLFARLLEVLEARMRGGVVDGDGDNAFGDQAGEAFVQRHAQRADAARAEAEGGGENQVGAIGLEQVGGADVGAEARGDQRDDVHQRVGGVASIAREGSNLFQGQYVVLG